jgi:hypothetical protein
MFFSPNNPTNLSITGNSQPQMVGFDDAIKQLESNCVCPERSMSNMIVAASLTLSGADAWYGDVVEAQAPHLAIAGLNLGGAGFLKLKEFYDHFTKIQKTQLTLIKVLVNENLIKECYSISRSGTTKLDRPYSIDKVTTFLRQNHSINFELIVDNISFILINNGFCSLRLGAVAVSSFAATAISTGIFVSYHFANQAIPSGSTATADDSGMRAAAAIASALPFTSFVSKMIDICYKQEAVILRAVQNILEKVYRKNHKTQHIPDDLLSISAIYLDPEDMIKNREIRQQCISKADIEMQQLVIKDEMSKGIAALKDEILIELVAMKTELEAIKTKMLVMDHHPTLPEIREKIAVIETSMQAMENKHDISDLVAQFAQLTSRFDSLEANVSDDSSTETSSLIIKPQKLLVRMPI